MGFKTVLTGAAFSDTSLPVIRNDAILSKGSLFLFDPSHSKGVFEGFAANTVVPNVAWQEAAGLIPGGTEAALAGKVFHDLAAGEILVERTPKKAVHVVNSLINQTSERNWHIRPSDKIRDYLVANSAHKFYISLWTRRTRAGTGPGASNFHLFTNPSQLFIAPAEALVGYGKTNSRYVDTNGSVVPFRRFTNTDTTGINGVPTLFQLGSGMLSSWTGAGYRNKQNSVILYRAYIEDLTVSGRTYAEVDALDYALHQAAFAVGGRYFGDTNTDPATLP